MRKPRPLRPGDRVAVAAPAGFADAVHLERGITLLRQWGLEVELPTGLFPVRYLAGTDAARAASLTAFFEREEIAAILCVRGGYGASRLYPHFDAPVAAAHAKVFVGFSDISLVLARLLSEAGLVCFHGPMPGADLPRLSPQAQDRFRRFLFDEPGWWNGDALATWRQGSCEGPLVGGCLSVLVTTLGTPYEIVTDGAVLFLEDVAEKPYRIDRMLSHMRHAGKLDGVAGIVFGALEDCDDGQGCEVLREIVLDVLGDLPCPVAAGLDAGHGSNNVVLPLGCRVRLQAGGDGATLELCESPFAKP